MNSSNPRSQWRLDLLAPDDAAEQSIAAARTADRPVVIADTQDNPGAGGDSNTTGLLRALLSAKDGQHFPGKVAVGLMFDPEAAAIAHAAGSGAQITLSLGRAVPTYDGSLSDAPVRATFMVRALADGHVLAKGPMSKNKHQELGPCACLELDGILIAVSSGKAQMFDRELFRHVGIQPEDMKILVNKSSVHFRADFAPIADRIFVAKAKGPVSADPADLNWQYLRVEMHLTA